MIRNIQGWKLVAVILRSIIMKTKNKLVLLRLTLNGLQNFPLKMK
jgi:hypothetical protein